MNEVERPQKASGAHIAPRTGAKRLTGTGARRAQIIDAAEKLFLGKGYHCTRMDDIVQAAGVSKKTIYQIFSSKEELFGALLEARVPVFPTVEMDETRPPEDVLADLVFECVIRILAPQRIYILRLIMGEYSRSPDLGRIYGLQGPKLGQTTLEKCLAAMKESDRYDIDDIRGTATMLIGMALGQTQLDLLLGLAASTSKPALRRRINTAVNIFLKGTKKLENSRFESRASD